MRYQREFVYVLTHVPTQKKYVGRSVNPQKRKKLHLSMLKNRKHPCKAMQADFDKYGGEFTLEIICENTEPRQTFDAEKRKMVRLKTYDERYGYNANDIAMNPIRRQHNLPTKQSNAKRKAGGQK